MFNCFASPERIAKKKFVNIFFIGNREGFREKTGLLPTKDSSGVGAYIEGTAGDRLYLLLNERKIVYSAKLYIVWLIRHEVTCEVTAVRSVKERERRKIQGMAATLNLSEEGDDDSDLDE